MKLSRRDLLIGSGGLLGIGYLSTIGAKTAKADFANLTLSVSDDSVSTTDGTVSSVDVGGSQSGAIQLEWQGLESTDTADIELYADAPDQKGSGSSLTREPLTYNGNEIICHSDNGDPGTFEICDFSGTVLDSITYNYQTAQIEKREGYNEVYLLVHGSSYGAISHIDVGTCSEKNRIQLDKGYDGEPLNLAYNGNYFYVREAGGASVDIFSSDGTLQKSFNNNTYSGVNIDSNSLWLLRLEGDGTLSVLEYSLDGSTKRSEYLSVMPQNSDSNHQYGDVYTLADSDHIYVGGAYIDKINKSDGSRDWRMKDSDTPDNVNCSDIKPIINENQIAAKTSASYIYQINESDGSFVRSTGGGLNARSITLDAGENYIFCTQTQEGGTFTISYSYYRINRSDNSETAVGLRGNVLASQYVKSSSSTTTTVNEDLLVSGSISLNSLSGSFSGTFTDVFGTNPVNIPSNHADLKKSHFEEGTNGNTENTDVTFRLRVVLQTAGIEDNDSNTATYSVTNS